MNKEINTRLREISKRLKKEYHAQEVILFGSYATGKATKDSDVDLQQGLSLRLTCFGTISLVTDMAYFFRLSNNRAQPPSYREAG